MSKLCELIRELGLEPEAFFDELRKHQKFLTPGEWDNSLEVPCIWYALGISYPVSEKIIKKLFKNFSIEELKEFLDRIGFKYREISSPSEQKKDEHILVIYHYSYKKMVNNFGCRYLEDTAETHMARIEPNGLWTHKRDWKEKPCSTSLEEIHNFILEEDGVEVTPIYFAVKEPQ